MTVYLYHFFNLVFLWTLIANVLPWETWWKKGFDAGRFHLTYMYIIMIGVNIYQYINYSSLWIILVPFLLIAIVYNISIFIKYTPFHKKTIPTVEIDQREHLKILTLNVRMSNSDYDKTADLILKTKPDVVLLTEVNQAWIDGLASIREILPHYVIEAKENTYGIALFTNCEVENEYLQYAIEKDAPTLHARIKMASGQNIQLIGVHPKAPAPNENVYKKDLELLLAAKMTNWNVHPSLILGDMNDVNWSKTMRKLLKIGQLSDPRIGRGFYNTYNANIPIFRYPTDHIFLSHHFKIHQFKRLEDVGSDHYPLMAHVVIAA